MGERSLKEQMEIFLILTRYTPECSSLHTGVFRKYSDPLTFSTLLCYSLILKWILKIIIILSNLRTIPHKWQSINSFRHFCKFITNVFFKTHLIYSGYRKSPPTFKMFTFCCLQPYNNPQHASGRKKNLKMKNSKIPYLDKWTPLS